jgi:hypothetical protein
MKFSPHPCYLIPVRPKYSPQHPILKHPQPTYLPQCLRPSFTPIQNRASDYKYNLMVTNERHTSFWYFTCYFIITWFFLLCFRECFILFVMFYTFYFSLSVWDYFYAWEISRKWIF